MWTFSRETKILQSHAGRAKACKKDSRYLPMCTNLLAISCENLRPHSSEEQEEARDPDPDVEARQHCSVMRHYIIGIVLLQERESLFRRTIFRYLCITLMSRETQTIIDVLHLATIDDYRNVDGEKSSSDPWIGVTRFALLNKNPPEGHLWVQGRLTKKQVTIRPGTILPENGKTCRKALSAKP